MAVANVNGNLVDCNDQLSAATGFRREEVKFLTIFNLVADTFLQQTFSMISAMLSMKDTFHPQQSSRHIQVQGKRRDGQPSGLMHISVVRDDSMHPRFFVVTLL
ncbi:unnamed protein product, partial [Discosporangium mesarthrocarpum]